MAADGLIAMVTDGDFETFVKSNPNVIVDAWAPWCSPCKRLEPILEELARGYGARVRIAKLNTDENPSAAARYGIMSLPTLLVFKNGQRVDQVVGLMPKEQLAARFGKHF
jgi:thioredoxin 1